MSSSRETTTSKPGEEHQSTAQILTALIQDDYAPTASAAASALSTNRTRQRSISQLQPSTTSPAISLPSKQLSVNELLFGDTVPSKQCHVVRRAKKKSNLNKDYFYKINTIGALMAELEVVCGEFYHYLTPKQAPSAHACYDDQFHYVGVASKAIPNFKSLKEEPLTAGDLVIDSLKHDVLSIDDLKMLDKIAKEKKFNVNDPALKDDALLPESIAGTQKIKCRDLKNFRIIQGLGMGLTASYIFEEGDLHRGNMNKAGVRIDFDMSLWSILSKFKASFPLLDLARMPNKETFSVDAETIRNFPDLDDKVSPYYWPTKPAMIIHRLFVGMVNALSNVGASSPISNAFEAPDNEIFKTLTSNPIFIYYKFRTLLKYILTSAELFGHIANLHIRDYIKSPSESINVMRLIVEHQRHRIDTIKQVLIRMPEFQVFLNKHGETALKEIKAELDTRNNKLLPKLNDTSINRLIKIETIEAQYKTIEKEAREAREAAATTHAARPTSRPVPARDFRRFSSLSTVGHKPGSIYGKNPGANAGTGSGQSIEALFGKSPGK